MGSKQGGHQDDARPVESAGDVPDGRELRRSAKDKALIAMASILCGLE